MSQLWQPPTPERSSRKRWANRGDPLRLATSLEGYPRFPWRVSLSRRAGESYLRGQGKKSAQQAPELLCGAGDPPRQNASNGRHGAVSRLDFGAY